MMKRAYNFSAGPAVLPEKILLRAQHELLNYEDTGISILEMSHRSKNFDKIISDAETIFRRVYNIPDYYKVLFL